MKRLRLSMMFAILAVMAVGVQAVDAACARSMTLFYENGRYECDLRSSSATECAYDCRFYRIYLA